MPRTPNVLNDFKVFKVVKDFKYLRENFTIFAKLLERYPHYIKLILP